MLMLPGILPLVPGSFWGTKGERRVWSILLRLGCSVWVSWPGSVLGTEIAVTVHEVSKSTHLACLIRFKMLEWGPGRATRDSPVP